MPGIHQIGRMYLYIKSIHIIFVVTWFAGLFYITRLYIYNTEAGDKEEPAKSILRDQFAIMIRRLWLGITWPSAILTLTFGSWLWYLMDATPTWLLIKFGFIIGLFAYHLSLHRIYLQQKREEFRYSSQQLRIWNEVATVFLFAIVTLVVVKQNLSWAWGIAGLISLILVLMSAIRVYKLLRKR